MKVLVLVVASVALGLVVAVGCGSDDDASPSGTTASNASPDQVGQTCAPASACYPHVDAGALHGTVECLDRVSGGYCTHLCETDSDCCAVPGECTTGFTQLCAPFESTGQKMCFFSCEAKDLHTLPDGGVLDDTAYCQTYVATSFGCRSTGGGSANRKVCTP